MVTRPSSDYCMHSSSANTTSSDNTISNVFTNLKTTSADNTQPRAVAQEQNTEQVSRLVPILSPPSVALNLGNLANVAALPSPGALILSLITKSSSEARRDNKNAMYEQSKLIQDNILKQADEMKSKAVVQLVFGLISGAISVAQGVASGISTYKNPNASDAIIQAKQTRITAFSTAVNSTASAFGSYAASSYDVAIKKLEAQTEKFTNEKESLKSFNDSLSESIQKALSSMDNIQQGMNQTRAKILG